MAGSCPQAGTYTNTWTVSDACGNVIASNYTQVITVTDITAPVFTFVPSNTTVSCNSIPLVASPTATDNCSATVTITYNGEIRTNGSCPDSYSLTRSWTATDNCSNTATASQLITVEDITAPVFTFVPADITVNCDALPAAGNPTATDNCDLSVTIVYNGETRINGTCPDSYTLTRTWTATDNCSNSSTATQIITVQDITPPVFTSVPPNVTVNCQTIPAVGTPSATDNCDASVTIVYNGEIRTNGACADSYTLTRTWTATDNCNNSSTSTQLITVQDITPPVFTSVPANITVNCHAIPAVGTPLATDNCDPGVTIVYNGDIRTNGSCIDSYTLTRSWTATDRCGNSSVATQVISVQDITPPVFTSVPANITVSCSMIPAVGTPSATDNCAAAVTIVYNGQVRINGSCANNYQLTRTWTATDNCNNSTVASQVITVQDITPPVISCPANTTISCTASTAPSATGTATATDNCTLVPIITYADAILPGSCINNKVISRTWTARDECGNTSTCIQSITIVDNSPPVLTGTIPAGASGISACIANVPAGPSTATIAALFTDNCSAITVLKSGTPVGTNCSWTLTYTYTVSDVCGNVVSISPTVSYSGGDNIPPTANPMPVLGPYQCYSNRPAPNILDVTGKADNCGGTVTVNFVSDSPDPGCTGTVTRTYSIADACGNTSLLAQSILIQKSAPPVITAGSSGASECQGNNPDVNTDYLAWLANNGGATASDLCGNAISWTNTPGIWSGGCVNSITVTFTATDACGNASTTSGVFTISDTTPPVITAGTSGASECPGNNPNINTDYLAWLAANGGATATDLCGNAISWTNTPGTWSGGCVNSITVTFTATDACGNASTTSGVFTISDTTPPVIIAGTNGVSECQGNNPDMNTDYLAWLAANGGATASDLCGNAISWSYAPGIWSGGCVNSITVTFTATDACGNTSTTSGIFTISDTTPPVITAGSNGASECQGNNPDANTDYLTWLTTNGGATASDLCGNTISWSYTTGVWSGGWVKTALPLPLRLPMPVAMLLRPAVYLPFRIQHLR